MERREVSITTLLDSKGRAQAGTDITLAPLACWKHKKKEHSVSNNRAVSVDALMSSVPARAGSFTKRADGASSIDLPVRETGESKCTKSWVLHPGGIRRTIWNMAVALGVLHDLIFVPMYVFNLPSTPFFKIMEWITQIFWNFDMLVSLFTGYYDEGVLVLELRKAFLHYAKTWMCFDLCLITMDWAIVWLDTLGSEQEDFIQWSRTISMLRFLRLIRMLRWVKLRRVNEVFQELLHTQAASLYYSLIGSIARLLILNHLVACCWYAVGDLGGATGWVATNSGMASEGVFHKYLVCMNWAFAQLSVGSSELTPSNTLEFAFCVIVAFRSLLTYSTLISTMTSLLSGLSKIKEDETSEFRMLRSYLVHHDIGKELQQKVTRFLQHQYGLRQQAKSADAQVPLLQMLSVRLQGELSFAKYRKALGRLAFVDELLVMNDLVLMQVLHKLATKAVRDVAAAGKDVIFLAGDTATAAVFKVSGEVTYFFGHEKSAVSNSTWIAEHCLWTPWVHLGDLVSEDFSRLVVIHVQEFCNILSENTRAHSAAVIHARDFISAMRSRPQWTDILPQKETHHQYSERETALHQLRCCGLLKSSLPGARMAPQPARFHDLVHAQDPAQR
ncbi:CngA [Symbiodinium microadriaticum]|nr:CngA [Symbiodinium microadriaticum]